jgi:2,3-bisphosphoglycerate-independent phosphoglycerate mutase
MKTLLVVIDGLGLRDEKQGNAFKQAETPNIDSLMEDYGYQELEASGPAVGLPEGYTGNSEVGHLHMGAGRVIPQRLTRINKAIEEGKLGKKEATIKAFQNAEEKDTTVHLAGIISDGGIHGHIDHLKALMRIASNYDVDVEIHCFTDGRDVDPKSAEEYISQIKEWQKDCPGQIATVVGRFYSMDRDHNWERTHQAYDAMALGEGFEFEDPREAVEKAYEDGEYDYFIQPSVRENYEGMSEEDEVIFYNYRADRERQIEEELLEDTDPDEYEEPVNPNFTGMFPYERGLNAESVFKKKVVENTLGEEIAEKGFTQLRVAESQKKPHVTYFFNGQRELKFEGEERKFIESDKIRAYDERPEMHAEEIAQIVIEALDQEEKNFIMLNFANCDLVGHTGDLEATITAVETVDEQIGRLREKVEASEYDMVVTSDHGNCEDMGAEENPNTSHTTNKVPAVGIGVDLSSVKKIADLKDALLE